MIICIFYKRRNRWLHVLHVSDEVHKQVAHVNDISHNMAKWTAMIITDVLWSYLLFTCMYILYFSTSKINAHFCSS